MDWPKGAALGAAIYSPIFFFLVLADILSLPNTPRTMVIIVLNFFLVSFAAYFYFKSTSFTPQDGTRLGALWVIEAILLEYVLVSSGAIRGLYFVVDVPLLLYSIERLLLPLVFSRGLVEVSHQP